jgi:hypothetical protein
MICFKVGLMKLGINVKYIEVSKFQFHNSTKEFEVEKMKS